MGPASQPDRWAWCESTGQWKPGAVPHGTQPPRPQVLGPPAPWFRKAHTLQSVPPEKCHTDICVMGEPFAKS